MLRRRCVLPHCGFLLIGVSLPSIVTIIRGEKATGVHVHVFANTIERVATALMDALHRTGCARLSRRVLRDS